MVDSLVESRHLCPFLSLWHLSPQPLLIATCRSAELVPATARLQTVVCCLLFPWPSVCSGFLLLLLIVAAHLAVPFVAIVSFLQQSSIILTSIYPTPLYTSPLASEHPFPVSPLPLHHRRGLNISTAPTTAISVAGSNYSIHSFDSITLPDPHSSTSYRVY